MNITLIQIIILLVILFVSVYRLGAIHAGGFGRLEKRKQREEPMTPLGDLFEDGDRERGTPHVKGGRQPSKTPHTKSWPPPSKKLSINGYSWLSRPFRRKQKPKLPALSAPQARLGSETHEDEDGTIVISR